MSATSSWIPGGQPSTTQPIAVPWLSPQVVTRNRWPKLLCDMGFLCAQVPTLSLREVSPLSQKRARVPITGRDGTVLSGHPLVPRHRRGLLLLHHEDVGSVLVLHADHVVAGVYMQYLAGHAAP